MTRLFLVFLLGVNFANRVLLVFLSFYQVLLVFRLLWLGLRHSNRRSNLDDLLFNVCFLFPVGNNFVLFVLLDYWKLSLRVLI